MTPQKTEKRDLQLTLLGLQAECDREMARQQPVFPQGAQSPAQTSTTSDTVDKNAAYPVAVETLKEEETIAVESKLRQVKYLNNVVEQDYRNIKRITRPMIGFNSFNSARKTLRGIEAMNRIRKEHVKGSEQGGQCLLRQVY